MPATTHAIVAKRWKLCDFLKDNGVSDHQDVSEFTAWLVLKLAQETGQKQGIP